LCAKCQRNTTCAGVLIKVTAWMPLMRNRGLLDDPVIVKIAEKYHKTPAIFS
jgi:diketogulonate reductase-like aldo/keto reductase